MDQIVPHVYRRPGAGLCSCQGIKVVLSNKKKRVRCPECGRRMIARTIVCSAGCCVDYVIPPHKPKEWYKKKVKL